MNLKKSALLAEILGGLGIIISILYLAFEVAENTKNTRIANQLALVEHFGELRLLEMENPAMAEIIFKGSQGREEMSEVEQRRFWMYMLHSFDVWETGFLMNERQVLPPEAWALWNSGACGYFKAQGYRDIWASGFAENFTVRFRSNIDNCYAQ
jgi:hypothetical protein